MPAMPKVHVLAAPDFRYHTLKRALKKDLGQKEGSKPTLRSPKTYGTSAADEVIEAAARLCYMSYGKGRNYPEFIENILDSGHGSVLEHANFTLLITQVSRSLTHELVRHRAGFAYSELSQRYVKPRGAMVPPPEMEGTSLEEDLEHHFDQAMELYSQAYQTMTQAGVERKTAANTARAFLPEATETAIVVTANVRAWRHFIETRGSWHTALEIRHLAREVMHALQDEAPFLFGDYELHEGEEWYIEGRYSKV